MAKTIQVAIELPTGVLSALRQDPEQFVREMRVAAAVKWYEMELLSQSKAAEVAGVSRAEFLAALRRFHVSPFQISSEELLAEIDLSAHRRGGAVAGSAAADAADYGVG